MRKIFLIVGGVIAALVFGFVVASYIVTANTHMSKDSIKERGPKSQQ